MDTSTFFDGAASVSFVGRPFPLEEADLHLSRLQRWGLTFLRFIVTWEAIEHAGPGQIDREYLAYIRAVVEKAAEYNMQVYVDPHQDVWSRWTGGDGAPMWTLECIGFEPRHFEQTKAALCLETCGLPASQFPKMIWPTNYGKLACATMFTLFWAGKKFAPKCYVDGVQIQEYLQSHYLDALQSIGFRNGYAPSPFSGMLLGEGIAQDVEVWGAGMIAMIRGKPARVEHVDPKGVRAWKQGSSCIWKDAGVWNFDAAGKPQLLKPDYFANIDFGTECFLPFAREFTKRIQSISPKAMIFTEMPPTEVGDLVFPQIKSEDIPLAVNAMHWYDLATLFTTTWRSWLTFDFATGKTAFGNAALRALHQKQLAHVASFGREKMANAPTLIGETGIPYNLNSAQAYTTGDFSAQVEALDNTIYSLESQLLSFTLWNYTVDNSHKFGDLWNLEDLSISSPDSEALARRINGVRRRDDSARGLRSFARPYARKIAGVPSKSLFDLSVAEYVLEYASEKSETSGVTEIFVPYVHYPEGYRVTASDGHFTIEKHEGYDIVKHEHSSSTRKHRMVVLPTKPLRSTHSNLPVYFALAVALVTPYLEAYARI
ncbi:hypothetical protein JM18_009433 [Phytophthora kernoviae]|uniref:Glycoside hydrolase family 5 domain-containing protein n=1 Tax=Phytophthora kernoviae TaxID=325452 RepID=A0A921S969_9STRA|nr:hypothetical protein JM18_009433 [Phytophthora kernoviae]